MRMGHRLAARMVSKLTLPSSVLPASARALALKALMRSDARSRACRPQREQLHCWRRLPMPGLLNVAGGGVDSESPRDSARQVCHLCLGEGPLRAENVSNSPKIVGIVDSSGVQTLPGVTQVPLCLAARCFLSLEPAQCR